MTLRKGTRTYWASAGKNLGGEALAPRELLVGRGDTRPVHVGGRQPHRVARACARELGQTPRKRLEGCPHSGGDEAESFEWRGAQGGHSASEGDERRVDQEGCRHRKRQQERSCIQ